MARGKDRRRSVHEVLHRLSLLVGESRVGSPGHGLVLLQQAPMPAQAGKTAAYVQATRYGPLNDRCRPVRLMRVRTTNVRGL